MKSWTEYDWDDVTPANLAPFPGHMGQIAYSEAFKKVMGYFRAVAPTGERSERTLALTAAVIELAPAHYSVWDYRLGIVREIGNAIFNFREVGLTPKAPNPPAIDEDGDWLNALTLKNPKNYQVWNYRQQIADTANPLFYRGEKLLVQMVLEDDSKNFHAWSHLKWAVATSVINETLAFGDGSGILSDCTKLLENDPYNNSAWSYRYFIFAHFPLLLDTEKELAFVEAKLEGASDNESAWSYLRGYLARFAPSEIAAERANSIALKFAGATRPSARALEFLAERLPAAESKPLWTQLCHLEPMRKVYWETKIST